MVDKMKGWERRGEMKEGEGEEKVSRRRRRTAGENGRDEERGYGPWGASSPTSIMEKCMCVCERERPSQKTLLQLENNSTIAPLMSI